MTGAIPRFFRLVPFHDATQMGANRRAFRHLAIVIHGDRHQVRAAADHHALTWFEILHGSTTLEISSILSGDVEVFSSESPPGTKRLAGRIIQGFPSVGFSQD